jgi:hypothetical protein
VISGAGARLLLFDPYCGDPYCGDALMVTDRRMGLRPEGLLPVAGANVVDKHIRDEDREYECKDEVDNVYA